MGLYPSPVAENNSPSTPYNGPNVSQYGWTEQETGYYVQLLEYVEKCEEILKDCEEIKDDVDGAVDQVEDIYEDIVVIRDELLALIEALNEDLADFELKYNDFLAKYAHIIDIYDEIVDFRNQAAVSAAVASAAAISSASSAAEAEGYMITAQGYAQAADFDAAYAEDQADRAQMYAEMLEHPFEDMGTHTIMQGYPPVPDFSSIWYIVDGGSDPNDPSITWAPGDQLVYSKRAEMWTRLNGQALGEGGQVPIEILDDLIMQQGKKIRFKIDEFTDTTGMHLDADGDLVIGEIPDTPSSQAPSQKIGLAARELYNIYGTDAEGDLITYRLYDQNFKPTPTEIGAVKRTGDTMTGLLVAPQVKVAAAPVEPDDLVNKTYVDLVAGTGTFFGETPPVGAPEGSLWYCTQNGLSYLLYNDGNSTQWIENNPNYPSAVGDHTHDYLPLTGGNISGNLGVHNLISTDNGKNVILPYAENNAGIYWGNTDQWSRIHAKDGLVQVYNGTDIKRVYHEGYKPTPAAIGAVAKSGDTMTGDLGLQTKEIVIWGSGSSNAARGLTYKYPDGTIAGGFGFTWDGTNNSTSGFHVGPGAAGYGSPWLQVAPTYTAVNQSMFTVKASGTHSGARMYSTDTEAIFYHVNDAGYPVSGLGANTTTGIVSFTKNNPSTGAYEYSWLQFDPAAATGGVVRLSNPKTNHAQGTTADSLVRKDYVDVGFVAKASSDTPNTAIDIGASKDLNTYQTPGFYYQDANADATSGSNYPTDQAGTLIVTKAAGVVQTYIVYGSGYMYTRAFYSGVWSAWRAHHDSASLPIGWDSGRGLRIPFNGKSVWIGNRNTSYAHIETDAGAFHFYQPIETAAAQASNGNSLTRRDFVEGYAARKRAVIASGGNFTGYTMACAMMSLGGRTYPLTFPLVAGTYWIRNRGGENADRDYDFGVTVGGTAPNFTFSAAGSQGATVSNIHAW